MTASEAQNAVTPAKCKSCGAAIYWTTNEATKRRMPVDAKPDSRGNLWLTQRKVDGKMELFNTRADGPSDPQRNRWTSHFATCPSAQEHRQKLDEAVTKVLKKSAEKKPTKEELDPAPNPIERSGFFRLPDGTGAFINFAPRGKRR